MRRALRAVDRTRPVPPARVSIDNEYYEGIEELWWDPGGPAAALHAINRPRLAFYLDALGDLRGRRVLDAGCGGGLVARALAETGAVVVGVDRSLGSLRVARGAVGPRGGLFHPVRGRLERLPFADSAFDAVVAADVLEHIPDLPAAVGEIARILTPGGSLAFDTINRTFWAWFTVLWGAERVLRLVPRGTHDWRLLIRPDELDHLLRGAGLEAVAMVGLAPRIGPRDVARGLLRRRLDLPEFRTCHDRRASYLGHYRKAGAATPSAPRDAAKAPLAAGRGLGTEEV
ncbi:MAG TPA: bifunctional 2-polyprenyl-6-hydroxyphenol methylase/3-demethylubiquinol 3-O-methyltransferase UbiG [Actinomycetes bacterium]|nr:bifunctional 2-polyprenyl-6-hydroxyphenol methylase/3-demethylubiquinol 3-O-methyltransferase UbiG [Actinomycetes bacterium]